MQLREESTEAPPENGESCSSVSHADLMLVLGQARLALSMIQDSRHRYANALKQHYLIGLYP